MLDLKLIREKPDDVRANLARRKDPALLKLLDDIIAADKSHRAALQRTESLRKTRNQITEEVAQLKGAKKPAEKQIAQMKKLGADLAAAEQALAPLEQQLRSLALRVPNLLHDSVPVGASDAENKVVRTWGAPLKRSGLKGHEELALALDLLDLERAAKTSGARFYTLKGDLALLDLALQRFALDHLAKRGFTPLLPPNLLRRAAYEGVTDLADFETMLYKVEGEDLFLIATSEHPIAAMHMSETLPEASLPLRYAGLSPCYRKEAGAHGKDTKGIFRVHQFNKIEQFIFSAPEQSWALHEELIKTTEAIFQSLEIPYRVVNVCTGDIGTVAAKKYDLEGWFPAQAAYRELASCSNCTDYQARRLQVRYGT
ncbi:MAG TPA: serine--tRNA ligase, partial [archaeon]|nr:serine--tRNA ligase [archaeon]